MSAVERLPLFCSFCGKEKGDVAYLVAGPTVIICNERVELCREIGTEMLVENAVAKATAPHGAGTMNANDEWKPYFAWWPVWVDAYDNSEIKNGKMRYRKSGWVERRWDSWTEEDEHWEGWKYRLARKPTT